MISVKQIIWFFLLLTALAFSSWRYIHQIPAFKINTASLINMEDSSIHKLHVTQFDEQGNVSHELTSVFVEHIPNHNTHRFKQPLIRIAKPGQQAWEIHAKNAVALYGGEEITFCNGVKVYQPGGNNNTESTLLTQQITYYPKDKVARTKNNITFTQPGNQVKARGMNVFLAENRVQLLHQARGIYNATHQRA